MVGKMKFINMFPNLCHEFCNIIEISSSFIFGIFFKVADLIVANFNDLFSTLFGQPRKILHHYSIHLTKTLASIKLLKDGDDCTRKGTNQDPNSVSS